MPLGWVFDKPDVRFVIDMDMPDSIESYFQEAGRAGRDEKKAHGILLFDKTDVDNCNLHFDQSFPELKEIRIFIRHWVITCRFLLAEDTT